MMTIALTPTQTTLWTDPEWRAGFLAGAQGALDNAAPPPAVTMVIIEDNTGTELGRYQRTWVVV